ncbi:MAG: signal peptidase II [Candidatus Buchananbacteria bacterium]
MKKAIKITSISVLGLFLFLVDRILKHYISEVSVILSSKSFFSWFMIEKTINRGVAFGIPVNYWLLIFLYIIIVAALCFLAAIMIKKNDYISFGALFIIICGAFSNFIDRISFGYVIDYFNVLNFSVFNVADVMITCGAVIFIISNFFNKKNAHSS